MRQVSKGFRSKLQGNGFLGTMVDNVTSMISHIHFTYSICDAGQQETQFIYIASDM